MAVAFSQQGRHKVDQGEPAETHEKGKHGEEEHQRDQQIRQQRERKPAQRRECAELAWEVVVGMEMAAI
jgi:hypothetical protein